MKQLPYIEDYIVLMADHVLSWPPKEPVIKLARYDEPIVNSMNEQIANQVGFTDKQSLLAHKIVIKYRKQWATAGYTIEHLSTPRFKFPIRQIDRSQHINVTEHGIDIRFPYNQELISYIRAAVNEIPGRLVFDRDRRCWTTALIEPRLIWAKEFGTKYNFSFGPEFNQCLDNMLDQKDYAIQLRYNGTNLEITNAADSLCDYVQQHGGFDVDNLVRLIDLAGICQYQVDPDLYQLVNIDHSILTMLHSRDVNLIYETNIDLGPVIKYARLTNRFPIYVYESGQSMLRHALNEHFAANEILDLKSRPSAELDNQPVVYFNHWKLAKVAIPLLVTSHTLMIGNRRQQMLQAAEKIVYYSQQITEDAILPITNT